MSTFSSARKQNSIKAGQFKESVIREMSRIAAEYQAVNLAQGLPDFPCPPEIKEAACRAINDDINQYAVTWGDKLFRQAIAESSSRYLGMNIDADANVTVTCGATEAMIATMLATMDSGDEVIVFEPYYENYGPDAILGGAKPSYVSLHPPDWHFDESELRRAFNDRSRAIIINTPQNPVGKVFSRHELEIIAELCQKWGVMAFTDEIYEHILYDDQKHIAIGSLPGMEPLTVTINSLSKTYSVTGWRVGWAIANSELSQSIRKVHDFLTVGSPAPLQRAGVTALSLAERYYDELKASYTLKREALMSTLDEVGIRYFKPQGAYYLWADIGDFGYSSDVEFARYLAKDVGVAVVPGSSFFSRPELGHRFVRFCFSKKPETLDEARRRLHKLKSHSRV